MSIEIIECQNTKEIPSNVKLDMFALSKDYTIDAAAKVYKSRFGVDPQKGYRWGNYIYFEIGRQNDKN